MPAACAMTAAAYIASDGKALAVADAAREKREAGDEGGCARAWREAARMVQARREGPEQAGQEEEEGRAEGR